MHCYMEFKRRSEMNLSDEMANNINQNNKEELRGPDHCEN